MCLSRQCTVVLVSYVTNGYQKPLNTYDHPFSAYSLRLWDCFQYSWHSIKYFFRFLRRLNRYCFGFCETSLWHKMINDWSNVGFFLCTRAHPSAAGFQTDSSLCKRLSHLCFCLRKLWHYGLIFFFFAVSFNRHTSVACAAIQPWYEETHMFGHVDKPGDVSGVSS